MTCSGHSGRIGFLNLCRLQLSPAEGAVRCDCATAVPGWGCGRGTGIFCGDFETDGRELSRFLQAQDTVRQTD